MMDWKVYLSGEIHTEWRKEIIEKSNKLKLPIKFFSPITNHSSSDNCGSIILGEEGDKFWNDRKSAKINSIRTRTLIKKSDIIIIKFGEKYKQWNAAFDAGFAASLSKPLIIIHQDEHQHALKEIDAVALAVTKNVDQSIKILNYTINEKL